MAIVVSVCVYAYLCGNCKPRELKLFFWATINRKPSLGRIRGPEETLSLSLPHTLLGLVELREIYCKQVSFQLYWSICMYILFYLHLCSQLNYRTGNFWACFSLHSVFLFFSRFSCIQGIASSVRGEDKHEPNIKTNFDLFNFYF